MQSGSKNNWVLGVLVLLLIGLLVSRALLSFASVLLVVPFFFNYRSIRRMHVIAIALLLFPVAVSGLWSDDTQLWWNSISVKLPLLTMMLGLCSVTFSSTQWKYLAWIFLLIVSAGCCWSLSQYSLEIQEAYLKAKTLPTPMDNDHIRFSWLVVVAVIMGAFCCSIEENKKVRALLLVVLAFLITYLHILAAKTGLVCLYGACFLFVCYLIVIQKKWKTGIGIVAVILAMAVVCYQAMPTLRNRIQYVVYDFQQYSKGNAMPGYNDASRWLSIRAGYQILTANPLYGAGAGDVMKEVDAWHNTHHPQSLPYERFLPANEWLVYGAAAGWPGFLFFTAGLLLLLYTTTSKNGYSFVLSATALVPFLVDDTLEGQYGVVILAFIAFFGQQKLTAKRV